MIRQDRVDTGTKPPSGSIPDHRVADLAARCKTDADEVSAGFARAALAHLHHHARGCPFAVRPGSSKEFTPFFQSNVSGLFRGLGHAGAETTARP